MDEGDTQMASLESNDDTIIIEVNESKMSFIKDSFNGNENFRKYSLSSKSNN